MKRFFIVLILCTTLFTTVYAEIDSVLKTLNKEIENRDIYFNKREQSIQDTKDKLNKEEDKSERVNLSRGLFYSYISYNYDSAYYYARSAYDLAIEINDSTRIIKTQYDLVHCYLSAGFFKEVTELLNYLRIAGFREDTKYRYYNLSSRMYADMCNYSTSASFYDEYNKQAILYIDSALTMATHNTASYDHLEAYKYFIKNDETIDRKIEIYTALIEKYNEDLEKNAMVSSILGELYYLSGDMERAIYYMALAATADIRKAIRETTAMSRLAAYLYEYGRIEEASDYIYIALEDANYYNARHRKIAINDILPLIEKERVNRVKEQKQTLTFYLIIVSLLILFLTYALFIIYKQNGKLHQAKKELDNQLTKISIINKKLERSNHLKDREIFLSLYKKSEYLDNVEVILKRLDRKLKTKQYNDINALYKDFSLKAQREDIYQSFDQAFLEQFPNFVEEYNKLIQPGEEVSLDEKGNLPPEIRIFALIRLGMNEGESIARFLNLSVNTIYSYKTRVKNKAIVPKEEFELRIMKIKKS